MRDRNGRESTSYYADSIDEYNYVDACEPNHEFRPKSSAQPEHELLAAVLEDALNCYFNHIQAQSRFDRKLFAEAEQWFFNKEEEGPFCFENVCSFLGIDPDYVRRGLSLFKKAHGNVP